MVKTKRIYIPLHEGSKYERTDPDYSAKRIARMRDECLKLPESERELYLSGLDAHEREEVEEMMGKFPEVDAKKIDARFEKQIVRALKEIETKMRKYGLARVPSAMESIFPRLAIEIRQMRAWETLRRTKKNLNKWADVYRAEQRRQRDFRRKRKERELRARNVPENDINPGAFPFQIAVEAGDGEAARVLANMYGDDFKHACVRYSRANSEFAAEFDAEKMTWKGRKLYVGEVKSNMAAIVKKYRR